MPHCLKLNHLFHSYSANTLSYSLGKAVSSPLTPLDDDSIASNVDKILRLSKNSGRPYIVLFGAGDGKLPKALAKQVLAISPEKTQPHPHIILCELIPDRIRQALANTTLAPINLKTPQNQCPALTVLTDSSPRALLMLMAGCGINLENSVFYLHPNLPKPESNKLKAAMQLVQHSQACNNALQACNTELDLNSSGTKLSILAIFHPDETHVDEFCEGIPAAAKELVIVWDSSTPVFKNLNCACPVIQKHRHLADDFAAQRNYALEFCTAPWVLALDADERLAPSTWQQVLEITTQNEITACFLPRLTFYPNELHFRAGFGLWPDPQLRLFKKTPQTQFSRPVHEVLHGVEGSQALLLHAPILHYSYILKNRELLQQRLAVFNKAVGREAHRLNQEYPCLPIVWHDQFQKISAPIKYLVLPRSV